MRAPLLSAPASRAPASFDPAEPSPARAGGRSSWNGTQCTVFGATGFLGRYVVSKLGAVGCRVIVPFRGDEVHARHLKPMGDLGAINFCPTSIRSLPDIERAVEDSNVVINLLGKHYETR